MMYTEKTTVPLDAKMLERITLAVERATQRVVTDALKTIDMNTVIYESMRQAAREYWTVEGRITLPDEEVSE